MFFTDGSCRCNAGGFFGMEGVTTGRDTCSVPVGIVIFNLEIISCAFSIILLTELFLL